MKNKMNDGAENRRNQIDRYVQGKMDVYEAEEFEQRMREHAELAETVHVHRDVLYGIEYYFMQQLKHKLIASDKPLEKGMPLWMITLIVLGGLALLMGIAYLAGWIQL
ncbi:MAG: hypothetical protein ACLFUB_06900 [Cyclobacteriaceae bacterium]